MTDTQTWTSALGIPDIADWDPRSTWETNERASRLEIPLGFTDDRDRAVRHLRVLDLSPSDDGGDGQHVTIEGGTGSGKTCLLRTAIVSLAATHSPEQVNIIYIDPIGVSAPDVVNLPHVIHSCTSIADIAPALSVIEREIDRRTGALIRYSASTMSDYRRARSRNDALADVPAIPDLVIVVDGYDRIRDIRAAQDILALAARLRPEIGIRLLVASQETIASDRVTSSSDVHISVAAVPSSKTASSVQARKSSAAHILTIDQDFLSEVTARIARQGEVLIDRAGNTRS